MDITNRVEERTFSEGNKHISITLKNGQFKNASLCIGNEVRLDVNSLEELDIVADTIKFIKDQLEEKENK